MFPAFLIANKIKICYADSEREVFYMRFMMNSKAAIAEVDTLGAELKSFTDMIGTQYLWQGDPSYWHGQAPILFPMVGRLREDKALIGGREYSMKRHGIARNLEFRPMTHDSNSVILSLTADEETKKSYPFDFSLMVAYRLEDCTLTTEFTVMNMGNEPMPFAIGGHPAFNCPVLDGEKFESYSLVFEKPETISCPKLDLETGLIDNNDRVPVLNGEAVLPLKHSLFDEDALIFEGLQSQKVQLVSRGSGRGVEMDFSGFPYLGVWSALGNAPFVALEPWTGTATYLDEGDEFAAKRGMKLLAPNASAKYAFRITVM